jgi:hypothetical protein
METDFVRNALSMSTESTKISMDTRKLQTFSMHTRWTIKVGVQGRLIQSLFLVEAGSNTSTVALRDVGGDEKGSL